MAMNRLARRTLLGGALLLAGCPAEPEPAPTNLCDTTWGPAPSTGRLHVAADGSASGDGSATAPFGTLNQAVAASRLGGERQIVIGPGDFPGHTELGTEGVNNDNDLEIVGCGRGETSLVGVVEDDSIGGMPIEILQPVVEVFGAETAGVRLRDLALVGGRRSLAVSGGAGAAGAIEVVRVDVLDSARIAVLIDGVSTLVELSDVLVDGIEPEDDGFGWGVAVQTNQWFGGEIAAPTMLSGVEVLGAKEIGVFAAGAWVDLSGVVVQGVETVDGLLGRGIQLQQFTRGSLSEVTTLDNSDAGVFLESPGRPITGGGVSPVELLDCTFGPTLEAQIEGSAETAADGLTITQYVEVGPPAASEAFLVVLDDSTFGGNERAHALVERVTLEVGPNNVFGKGAGYPLASQDNAIVQGIGGGTPGEEPVLLGEAGGDPALGMRRDPLPLDDPAL